MKRLFVIVLLLVSSTAIADWTLIGSGTGFVVNKDYVLTAAHVLEDCDGASIRYKHKEIDTDIVAIDSTNDLGLLLVEKPFEQTAKFRSGKPIRLGDAVVNYGYPLFGELSDHAKISRGVINSLAGWGNDSRHIQYDAPTQPGNSGGPVLDLSGNVVGIVSSGLSQRYAEETGHIAQNVNFAVKSFVAEAFLSSNGVDFETAESIEKMETADIAEKAETFTVLVGCWEGFDEPVQATPEVTPPDKETEPERPVPPTEEPVEGEPCDVINPIGGKTAVGVWTWLSNDAGVGMFVCRAIQAKKEPVEGEACVGRTLYGEEAYGRWQWVETARVWVCAVSMSGETDPEQSAPKTATYFVELDSKPAGGNVFINDIFEGVTPLTMALGGRVVIRVEKDGYKTFAREYNITKNRAFLLYLEKVSAKSGSTPITEEPVEGEEVLGGACESGDWRGSFSGIWVPQRNNAFWAPCNGLSCDWEKSAVLDIEALVCVREEESQLDCAQNQSLDRDWVTCR